MSIRPVIETRRAQPHIEGAGVHLHRAFGFQDPTEADPFLLFDDFRGDRPRDYMAGFPWHPHRGIETIMHCHPALDRRKLDSPSSFHDGGLAAPSG
jgi:redox-sensitive bicupin YhaK (pirin superfamily)